MMQRQENVCFPTSACKMQYPQLKGSHGFGGNLMEEATLDVETLPKIKHHPSLCNKREGERNCIFSSFITWQTKGRTSYCVSQRLNIPR